MKDIDVHTYDFVSRIAMHHCPGTVYIENFTLKVCHYNTIKGLLYGFAMPLEYLFGLFPLGDVPDTLNCTGNISIAVV